MRVEKTASYRDVERLEESGLLSVEAAERARALISTPAPLEVWRAYGRWALLGLGLIQILAGVIFFFAANWSLLSKWERLGPLLVVMTVCALVAWSRHENLTGKLCLASATVLVGVFMAVYGQIYQTGADAWTLFANWAGLTAIWVWAIPFWPTRLLWLLILETALVTFTTQYLGMPGTVGALGCSAVCGVALIWISMRCDDPMVWIKRFLQTNALGAVSIPALVGIAGWTLEPDGTKEYVGMLGLILAVIVIISVFVAWRLRAIADLYVVALCLALAMTLFTVFVFEAEWVREPLLLGLLMVVQVGAAGAWLKSQWKEQLQ